MKIMKIVNRVLTYLSDLFADLRFPRSSRGCPLSKDSLQVAVLADKILQQIPESVIVKDAKTLRILWANTAAGEWLRTKPAKLIGKTVFEVIHDNHSAALINSADREAAICGAYDMECWLMINGQRQRVRSTRYLFRDTFADDLDYVVTLSQDVTARHAAIVRAEDLERTTTALLTSLPFPVLWLDRSHKINGNNQAFSRDFCVDLPINHTLLDIFPFIVAQTIRNLCSRVESANKAESVQMTVWTSTASSHREMIVHAHPLHNIHSQVIGTVLAMYDVTEIIQESQLTANVSMTFELSADPVLVAGGDQKIVYANTAFYTKTGFLPADVIGQHPSILKTCVHGVDFYSALWSTLDKGRPWTGAISSRSASGGVLLHDATILPLLDKTRKPCAYVSIWHNDLGVKDV